MNDRSTAVLSPRRVVVVAGVDANDPRVFAGGLRHLGNSIPCTQGINGEEGGKEGQ